MAKTRPHAPDTLLSFFGVLIMLTISTGIVFEKTVPGLWIIAYSALLSGAGLLGSVLYGDREGWNNPPKLFGLIGIVCLAYLFTWIDMWEGIGWNNARAGWHHKKWGVLVDAAATLALMAGWLWVTLKAYRRDSLETITLAAFPILSGVCFVLGSAFGEWAYLVNALIFNAFMLFVGVMYITLGCRDIKLRKLNGGMAILGLLLVTRFFDAEFDFVTRGLVFIVLGTCFLVVNVIVAKRKKQLEVAS